MKAYSDRYWEMFNEIDGSYDEVTISTFKAGLLAEHDLRKSLTGKPITNVRLLMDRIDKYRRIEEDQLQGKGKAKVIPQERRDSRSDQIQIIDLRETLQGIPNQLTLRQLTLCFENQCSRFWRRLRTNRSSDGRIRWQEIL